MPRSTALFFLLAIAPLVGCQTPIQPDGPTYRVIRISDREQFLNQAMTLLREHDIEPRQVDRAGGLIVAGPTTAGQWFEFWRADTRGAYNTLEANLQTIRQTVTLRLDPAKSASQPTSGESQPPGDAADREVWKLTVQVDKQRLSAPERQATTTGSALAMFSERVPTEEGYRDPKHLTRQWVPVGRNAELEEYLADRLTWLPSALPALGDSAAPAEPESASAALR